MGARLLADWLSDPLTDLEAINRRLDAPDKVLGRTTYGIDVRLPNMLNAALIQCPVFKGTLKSVDDAQARRMLGVRKIVALKLPVHVA